MELYYYDHCTADAEGTRDVVDVGECVNVCYGWVSGFAGLRVCPHQYRQNCTIIVITNMKPLTLCVMHHSMDGLSQHVTYIH